MTLREIEQKLKRNGTASKEVDFYGPDGSRYAKSSTILDVMRFPYFNLRLDGWNEFAVHSTRAFKQSLSVSTAAEREFTNFAIANYNISELKARSCGKLYNYIVERLEQEPSTTIRTHEDVSMMLRDGIAKQCLQINSDRERLI